MTDANLNDKASSGRGLLLWTLVLTGPVVWLMQFQARYSLAQVSCSDTADLVLKIIAIVSLLCTVAAGALSWRTWMRAGHSWPNDVIPPPPGSTLLLSILGMLSSAMFSLVIIAQLIPNFFFATCD